VATGTVGEIRVRGPNVMRGYYRDAAETAKTLTDDGWLKTGDLGRVDAAGNLYVVGRLKELIIRSGFNVYPPEVEAALAAHADVALAAVVGRRVGENEEVIAFLQPVAGHTLDEADLRRHAEERLAPYKRPSRYVFLAQLPVTAAGKVLKARLLAALGGVATP
jgi:acyl-CoA synthetase (AMP-forming)/AMP-acid ligase II